MQSQLEQINYSEMEDTIQEIKLYLLGQLKKQNPQAYLRFLKETQVSSSQNTEEQN
jgi:hypothetical protein